MSMLDHLQNTDISPKKAALVIGTGVLILSIAVWLFWTSYNRAAVSTSPSVSVADASAAPKTSTVKVDVTEKSVTKKGEPGKKAVSSEDEATKIIADRDLFKPVIEATQAGNRLGFLSRGGGQIPPMGLGGIPVLPGMDGSGGPMSRRFGGGRSSSSQKTLAYTGLVNTPDGVYGLLEDTSSGMTKYVREGQNAFGVEVVLISPETMSVDSGGQMIRLGIGENKTNTATTAAAAGPPGVGGIPAGLPGQPNQPGQAVPTLTPGGGLNMGGFGGGGGTGRRGRRGGGGFGGGMPAGLP